MRLIVQALPVGHRAFRDTFLFWLDLHASPSLRPPTDEAPPRRSESEGKKNEMKRTRREKRGRSFGAPIRVDARDPLDTTATIFPPRIFTDRLNPNTKPKLFFHTVASTVHRQFCTSSFFSPPFLYTITVRPPTDRPNDRPTERTTDRPTDRPSVRPSTAPVANHHHRTRSPSSFARSLALRRHTLPLFRTLAPLSNLPLLVARLSLSLLHLPFDPLSLLVRDQ